jgi:hypothetical protein
MTPAVLLALVSPAVAIMIALWGFRRSTRADKLQAFFEMQDRYLDSEVRAGRRVLHQKIGGRTVDEVASLDHAVLGEAGHALAVMNAIAIACEGNYVDRVLVAQSMGRSFSSAVTAAQPYIDYVEQIRGFRPYPFAERLAARLSRRHGVNPSILQIRGTGGHDDAGQT